MRRAISSFIAKDDWEPLYKYQLAVDCVTEAERVAKYTGNQGDFLLNAIPYINALINDAVLLKGRVRMEQKNYLGAIQEAAYLLGANPGHKEARRLMAAALQAEQADPIDTPEPSSKRPRGAYE